MTNNPPIVLMPTYDVTHSPRQDNFRMEMYEVDKSRIDCVGSVDNDDQKIY